MIQLVWSYLVFSTVVSSSRLQCNRTLEGIPPKPNPGHFQIEISGNPSTYVPGEQYTGKTSFQCKIYDGINIPTFGSYVEFNFLSDG